MNKKITSFLCHNLYIIFMFIALVGPDLYLRTATQAIGFYGIHHVAPLFFTVVWATIIMIVVTALPRVLGKWLYLLVNTVFIIYGCAQYIYYQIFQNFIWLNDLAIAGEGADYMSFVFGLFDEQLTSMLAVGFLCMLAAFFFFPKRKVTIFSLSSKGIILGITLIIYAQLPNLIGAQQVSARWDSWRDPRNVYDQFSNQTWMMQVSGLYEYTMRDFYLTYFKSNVVDESEYDNISEYLMSKPDIEDNNMTGIFKDKNVIVVMLESIDDWLISETYTPTMKYMMDNGINFTDHYAPIFSSGATFNSEFTLNTGTYSPNGGNAAYSFSKNNFSTSLPNLFKEAGYQVKSFHFNEPEFYNRGLMHKNLGFEKHISFTDVVGDYDVASIDTIMTQNEEIYREISGDQKFFDFIITYSAHLPYSPHATMCGYEIKNTPDLWDYDENEETNCINLQSKITDDFLADLMSQLEAEGKMKDTVIIAYTDHYSYGYTDKEKLQFLSEEAGSSIVDKVPFFIYTPGMEAMEVSKTNSTIDMLPTIANLFGLNYSKEYIGYDIFDERYSGYTYFKDYSWYDGHTYYKDNQVVFTDGSPLSDVNHMNEVVSKNISIGEKIVTADYFAFKAKYPDE